ncbi:E3 ubiquitin-protein ligase arc-1-like isoform X2 [Mya arenaria]|uniref:E3 ubiquitin-protein ligase arc-1-like isoform X2 n=1 Tax=Mya arenaria TaxID=6604 RepID=UPI0022DF6699|nr:E3 ubiquitin-protein ligase arc-1-like isoform X2 [Mya arenaria]
MEVSGKKILADASAVDATFCHPCSNDGETVPAEAYCTICKEFMCSTCTNVHKKQNISKFHSLLDKSSMPKAIKGQSDVPHSTEPCDVHPEEFIKYFCPAHQTLNCGHCLVKDHRTCHVDIISEISICFQDCQEYGDIMKAISQLSKDLGYCTEDIQTKLNLIKQLAEDEMSRLHKYRKKIKTYFDERENALLKIIEEMKSTDETRLRSMKPKCDILKGKMEEIKTKLAKHERNTTQLFIEVKRAKKQIQSLQCGLTDIKKDTTFHRYQIRKDTATEKLLSSSTGLGTVDEIQSSEKENLVLGEEEIIIEDLDVVVNENLVLGEEEILIENLCEVVNENLVLGEEEIIIEDPGVVVNGQLPRSRRPTIGGGFWKK